MGGGSSRDCGEEARAIGSSPLAAGSARLGAGELSDIGPEARNAGRSELQREKPSAEVRQSQWRW